MAGRHRRARVGIAGWSIPAAVAESFPQPGSHLERYAARLNAAEINSSFHRPHRRSTYERWAASVPDEFRFAVKIPKSITHERRLLEYDELLDQFAAEVSGLGQKLGGFLVQLPPSFSFSDEVRPFFRALRDRFSGFIVCEPRHESWFGNEAEDLFAEIKIGRVAADPAPVATAGTTGGWPGIAYFRLHGSPRIYWSRYDDAALETWCSLVATTAERGAETWVVFDNTAAGGAIENALCMKELLTALESSEGLGGEARK